MNGTKSIKKKLINAHCNFVNASKNGWKCAELSW